MMHSNSFVLAVKGPDGRILREMGGRVFLPFNSEYSLLLKNLHGVRACCSVSIDGTEVLGGEEMIIPANGSVDLQRFMVNGDLNSGSKFKFVPLSDSQVQDPSSPENGIIEVKFWKEKSLFNVTPYVIYNDDYRGKGWKTTDSGTPQFTYSCQTFGGSTADSLNSVRCCAMSDSAPAAASNGATVMGSASSQAFTKTSFTGKDGEATILRLVLVGREQPLTVTETKSIYCVKCGKKNVFSHDFCCKCGTKLAKDELVRA